MKNRLSLLVYLSIFFIIITAFTDEKDKQMSIQRGENVYIFNCINCHMADGKGESDMYPPLAGSDFLKNNIETSIKMTMLGSEGGAVVNGKTYTMAMEAIYITDQELADVMNYVLNSWENSYDDMITVEQVGRLR